MKAHQLCRLAAEVVGRIGGEANIGIGMGYLVVEDEYRNLVGRIDFGSDELTWFDVKPEDLLRAQWYFRYYLEEPLRNGRVPEDGIEHLRKQYVNDATANPEALKQLREIYPDVDTNEADRAAQTWLRHVGRTQGP